MPKTITHEAKLHQTEPLLKAFVEQIEPISEKAGPILIQLPPSLAFDTGCAGDFLAMLRAHYQGEAVIEPRHATWFSPSADALLKQHTIARAAADPPKGTPEAAEPGGSTRLVYYRLHGAPRTYYSSYEGHFLDALATKIKSCSNAWIIFDNTALAHAYANALDLQNLIAKA